jgi:serine/threonine protein kinase
MQQEGIKQSSFDGQYKVIRVLGQGSFGKVYLAERAAKFGGGQFAVKELDYAKLSARGDNILQTTKSEIGYLQDLSNGEATKGGQCNPGIVCYYDIFQDTLKGDNIYIVMEYVAGLDLKESYNSFLREINQFNLRHRDQMANSRQLVFLYLMYTLKYLLKAIAYLHSKGIVHSDIKPENIIMSARPSSVKTKSKAEPTITVEDTNRSFKVKFVEGKTIDTSEYRPVLIDFGLSCRVSKMLGDPESCRGIIHGSPIYMAPELIRPDVPGQVIIYPESDLWSLGIAIYELLEGNPWSAIPDQTPLAQYLQLISNPNYPHKPVFQTEYPILNDIGNNMLEYDHKLRKSASTLYLEVSRYLQAMQ